MKKRPIPDRRSMGQSEVVPYDGGEDHKARHARRLTTNLAFQEEVGRFCQRRNVTFEVKNEGHHWIFRRGKQLIEWWPSSAKLVINKRWHKGIHVHDYKQAIRIIDRHFASHPDEKEVPVSDGVRLNDGATDYQI